MISGIAFLALLAVLVLGCQPAGSTPPGETFDAGPVFADATPMLTGIELCHSTEHPGLQY